MIQDTQKIAQNSIMNYIPFIGQGVNAASGIVGSIIQNKANRRMAEYSYKKDLEMWNRQNAYNSPMAQMARFKAAGLNPNLIYGQGTAGNSSSTPHYTAPKMEFNPGQLNLGESLGQYIDVKTRGQQLVNMQESNKNIALKNDILELDKAQKAKYLDKQTYWNLINSIRSASGKQITNMANIGKWNLFNETYLAQVDTAYAKRNLYSQQWQNAIQDNYIKSLVGRQKEKDIEFLDWGGKYSAPLISFLRLIFGR